MGDSHITTGEGREEVIKWPSNETPTSPPPRLARIAGPEIVQDLQVDTAAKAT